MKKRFSRLKNLFSLFRVEIKSDDKTSRIISDDKTSRIDLRSVNLSFLKFISFEELILSFPSRNQLR